MGMRGRKRKARRKKAANHGKRPNAWAAVTRLERKWERPVEFHGHLPFFAYMKPMRNHNQKAGIRETWIQAMPLTVPDGACDG